MSIYDFFRPSEPLFVVTVGGRNGRETEKIKIATLAREE
jgi:hypothetical protein